MTHAVLYWGNKSYSNAVVCSLYFDYDLYCVIRFTVYVLPGCHLCWSVLCLALNYFNISISYPYNVELKLHIGHTKLFFLLCIFALSLKVSAVSCELLVLHVIIRPLDNTHTPVLAWTFLNAKHLFYLPLWHFWYWCHIIFKLFILRWVLAQIDWKI